MLIAPLTIFDDAGVEIKSARLPGYFSGFFFCVAVVAVHLLLIFVPFTSESFLRFMLRVGRDFQGLYVFTMLLLLPMANFALALARARKKHHPAWKNIAVWFCLYYGGIFAFCVMLSAIPAILYGR